MMDQQRNGENEHANEWIRFGMKLAVQGVLHPFEYSKVLIQVSKFNHCLPFPNNSLSYVNSAIFKVGSISSIKFWWLYVTSSKSSSYQSLSCHHLNHFHNSSICVHFRLDTSRFCLDQRRRSSVSPLLFCRISFSMVSCSCYFTSNECL